MLRPLPLLEIALIGVVEVGCIVAAANGSALSFLALGLLPWVLWARLAIFGR